jgi:hypothetical protein
MVVFFLVEHAPDEYGVSKKSIGKHSGLVIARQNCRNAMDKIQSGTHFLGSIQTKFASRNNRKTDTDGKISISIVLAVSATNKKDEPIDDDGYLQALRGMSNNLT